MALVNPNIAMSYRPATEYQPRNALAEYAQVQQIIGGQQAQELNALKMREAQAALEERNALSRLNPADPDYENQLFKVSPQLGIQFRREAATTAAQRAAQQKSEFDLTAARRKFAEDLKRGLSANPSDENIVAFGQDALLQNLYTEDQVKSEVGRLLALPMSDRVRILSQAGASAADLRPQVVSGQLVSGGGNVLYTAPSALGAVEAEIAALKQQGVADNDPRIVARQNKIAQLSGAPTSTTLSERFVPVGRLVFDRQTQQYISPTQAQLTQSQERAPAAPGAGQRAPSGYRFTPAGELEPIPGGPAARGGEGKTPVLTPAQEVKRRDTLGKEFKAATSALQTTQDVLDSISFVRAEPGLRRATGYTGLLPSIPEGAAASAETRLKNLEGKVTALGKAQAAATGAIGSIATVEWKILSDQIAAIDRTKGTGPLLKQLELVELQAQGAMERIRDAYQRQFGEDFERFPQFSDLPQPKSSFRSGAPATSGRIGRPAASGVDTNNPLLK